MGDGAAARSGTNERFFFRSNMTRYKVTLKANAKTSRPRRVFYVRAKTFEEAVKLAIMLEFLFERPTRYRDRREADARVEALSDAEEG